MQQEDDFKFEPIRGLPALLPKGERILWQGSPSWKALTFRGFTTRLVFLWFFLVLAWNVVNVVAGDLAVAVAARTVMLQALLVLVAMGVLAAMAYASAAQTIYTVTNRRVVLRFGLAMDISVNLPFPQIGRLDMARRWDGTTDLVLGLTGEHPLGIWHVWPNSKPWAWSRPQPMLRALPEGEKIARLLGDALVADQARRLGTDATSEAAPMPETSPGPKASPQPVPVGGIGITPAE
ncbi:MAG: photosynthetic complex putative assembly protein PuhB [Pseudomonadota bacterium]